MKLIQTVFNSACRLPKHARREFATGLAIVLVTGATAGASAAGKIAPEPHDSSSPVVYSVTSLGSETANGIAVDGSGNVFVSSGNAIEKITNGTTTLLAGSLTAKGFTNGTGSAALFNSPIGLATDGAGNIYVADEGNGAVRKVTPQGVVSTVSAGFVQPIAVAVDGSGNIYVADTSSTELSQIAASGTTTTLLSGTALVQSVGMGIPTSDFTLNGVAVDGSGNPYAAFGLFQYLGSLTYVEAVDLVEVTSPGVGTLEFENQAQIPGAENGGGNNGAFAFAPDGSMVYLLGGTLYIGQTAATYTSNTAANFPYLGSAVAVDAQGNIYVAGQGVARVSLVGTAPSFSVQPVGVTAAYGANPVLSSLAEGTPSPSYQWQLDGADIPGATSPTLTASLPGTYTVIATNGAGSATSSPAVVTMTGTEALSEPRLVNISARAYVGTNQNVEIAGFVVSGPPGSFEQVLVRGAAASLSKFGVTGNLPDANLSLYDYSGNLVATNGIWDAASNATAITSAIASTGAFAFSTDEADAAILVNLAPGAHTAELAGGEGNNSQPTTGIGLAEIYEVKSAGPQFVNVSARADVGSSGNILIGGFVIGGTTPQTVLIRAAGPALGKFGVAGTLPDPELMIYQSNSDGTNTLIQSNTGWGGNAQIAAAAASVGAFSWGSAATADSAVLVTLPPGAYTAEVSGASGDSGVALVEVYQVP
jgi:sugar lactone lactonase YvrE